MKTIHIFSICLTLFLQGCIAAVGGGEIGTVTYTSDNLLRTDLAHEMPKKDLSVLSRNWREDRFNMHDVENEWGPPLEIVNVNDKVQEWKYKTGLRWRGFILVAIIPIPLGVPVGRESTTFTFTDGTLSRYSIVTDHWCVSLAGLILIPGVDGPPPGFSTGRECKSQKRSIDLDHYGSRDRAKCDFLFYSGCYKKEL
jgi:hypothetical protein